MREYGFAQLTYKNRCKHPIIIWFFDLAQHRFVTDVIKRGEAFYYTWPRFRGPPAWVSAMCPVGFTPSVPFPPLAFMDGSYKAKKTDFGEKDYRCLRLAAPTRCGSQAEAILVSRKPAHCGVETANFNCLCLALANRCNKSVVAFYRFSAGMTRKMRLKRNHADDSTACTRMTSDTVEYGGFGASR